MYLFIIKIKSNVPMFIKPIFINNVETLNESEPGLSLSKSNHLGHLYLSTQPNLISLNHTVVFMNRIISFLYNCIYLYK